ncbi:MAG: hypothetical protein ACOCZ5_00390 [bacterium]
MENLQPNNDLNALKDMFKDFQNKQSKTGGRKTSAEILAKYFVPRNTKEIFRILPPKPGRKHIEEAYFHVVTTITTGGKKKYGTIIYCPKHNDPPSPKLDENGKQVLGDDGKPVMVPAKCALCDKYHSKLSEQKPLPKGLKKENMNPTQLKIKESNDAIYKEAVAWQAKKFYIVRGIDRGVEKDGVKFWRFKHNFRNQGTLDKLLPILQDYMAEKKADFSCPVNGTDLSITMTDSEFNGRTYKSISAITYRGKSPLHTDKVVAEQWLEDDITWRDVFLPKKAPGITTQQFLELVAEGQNPYWDDSDANNKRWVFPGHPELEAAANTRNRDLGANTSNENIEYASDLDFDNKGAKVTANNMTDDKVGQFKDDAVDVGASISNDNTPSDYNVSNTSDDDNQDYTDSDNDTDDFDDLPF